MPDQTPAIMLESATSAKAVLNKPLAVSGSHNRRKSTKDYSSSRSYNDKSDTYCEEFSLQTLATTSDKRKAPDATKNSNVTMGMKNGKITNGLQVIVSSDEGSNTQTVLKENSTSCVTEVTVSQHSNLDLQNKGSIKYGKYLDLKNLPKDNNLKIDNVTDSTPISNIDRVNLMSSKGNGWRKDQIEITMNKSDSDSEDADVLSAFGISST
ncbi:unnamed protein product [Orchesella dallaii]|uniref:Uncharacterized protein n=1 Tax=Orchesella dallaii TaxID=48710 RepID=A0ABP1PUW6_9HEXA